MILTIYSMFNLWIYHILFFSTSYCDVVRFPYTALQRCLKELHSDCDLLDYNGTVADSNVLCVKLNFLQSLPQHPDDNDDQVDNGTNGLASNKDDPKIFPCIINYLDLSTLELKEEVLDRLTLPLLLCQEYKDILELIKKTGTFVIISGQPGIGEFLVSLSHRI